MYDFQPSASSYLRHHPFFKRTVATLVSIHAVASAAERLRSDGQHGRNSGPEVGLWEAHPADIPLAMPSLIPRSIPSLAIVQRATSVPLVTRQLDNPSHFSEL